MLLGLFFNGIDYLSGVKSEGTISRSQNKTAARVRQNAEPVETATVSVCFE